MQYSPDELKPAEERPLDVSITVEVLIGGNGHQFSATTQHYVRIKFSLAVFLGFPNRELSDSWMVGMSVAVSSESFTTVPAWMADAAFRGRRHRSPNRARRR
jgi:hypothetical protein